jgi:hypothetical protein
MLDLESGVSWFNPPLKQKAQTMCNINNHQRYIQFIKDLGKVMYLKDHPCRLWSQKEFEQSGYVRAKLTSNKSCYTKQYQGIMSVFKNKDILFSFTK